MKDYRHDDGLPDISVHFEEWFCGHQGAMNFAAQLWAAAQEWDDLQDEGQADHNAVLNWLAFEELRDPFLAGASHFIRPQLLRMFLDWSVANELERDNPSERDCRRAYILRASLYGVYHSLAWLIGGESHARQIGPAIWRTYGEPWGEYLEEMKCLNP